MQLIGQYGSDLALLDVAKKFEDILRNSKSLNVIAEAANKKSSKEHDQGMATSKPPSAFRWINSPEPNQVKLRYHISSDPLKIRRHPSAGSETPQRRLTDKEADNVLFDTLEKWSPESSPDKEYKP
jgi:hypothetical protein